MLKQQKRRAVLWLAVIALVAGLQLESNYHDRMARLPQIIPSQGDTVSVARAIAALDKYERALELRHYGWASLSFALLLAGVFAFTKNQYVT